MRCLKPHPPSSRAELVRISIAAAVSVLLSPAQHAANPAASLPKIRVADDGRTFVTATGQPFVLLGVNYYRPGTGWAPQVWKQFDAEATRRDFARLKELNLNCVRVFLTYGAFYQEPGKLDPEGLAKFDQFLDLAEAAGIYVHPTGPDHWEGLPEWARGDRIAEEQVLEALTDFWKLLAWHCRDRTVLFAYDLLNEPEVRWDSPALRSRWRTWVEWQYPSPDDAARAWHRPPGSIRFDDLPIPERKDAAGDPFLLDYQRFRESVAEEWTRRQAAAIKSADPNALVTVGLIQWSVPVLLAAPWHYSAFRPDRVAQYLDFLEVHFYPLDRGAYDYADAEAENRNLAYLESVVREVAKPGKPVVLGEFGWYGGGQPALDGGRLPAATEEQQARWCRRAVETTTGLACGWLNWGFHDHPQARDISQLTGLLTVDGAVKAWGREFSRLSQELAGRKLASKIPADRPEFDWAQLLTSTTAGHDFREQYYRAFSAGD